MFSWLLDTNAGLFTRIALGATVLCAFAVVDLRRNGKQARRWREYAFLVACVGFALLYGFINDQLTVTLSWEYFYYGKDLMSCLGPATPPAEVPLRLAAAEVGAKATWSAGLILGVILLFANNPKRSLEPLPFRRLVARVPLLFAITGVTAILLGIAGWFGALAALNSEFDLIIRDNLWRPTRFMAVYGIHLGGYVGGLLGAVASAISIRRERRLLPPAA